MGAKVHSTRPFPRSKSGNSFILIVLDHQTKFVLLKALSKASVKAVVKFLTVEVFHKFGVPETIHSDNGPQLVGKEFRELIETFGISDMRTAFHAPQANASERVNQSILASIRTYLDSDQSEFDQNLSNIECALRSSVQASIGVTPYFALFGTNMITYSSAYQIAKKLNIYEANVITKSQKLELIRKCIKQQLHKAFERNVKTYN